jgi:hypothetical protein
MVIIPHGCAARHLPGLLMWTTGRVYFQQLCILGKMAPCSLLLLLQRRHAARN